MSTLNLFFLDGKLVGLEEVWENVPDVYRERLEHEKWTFLTQQVHVRQSFYGKLFKKSFSFYDFVLSLGMIIAVILLLKNNNNYVYLPTLMIIIVYLPTLMPWVGDSLLWVENFDLLLTHAY